MKTVSNTPVPKWFYIRPITEYDKLTKAEISRGVKYISYDENGELYLFFKDSKQGLRIIERHGFNAQLVH